MPCRKLKVINKDDVVGAGTPHRNFNGRVHSACLSLVTQQMKGRSRDGSHLPKVTQKTVAATDGFCHAPPPHPLGPLQSAALRAGARLSPPPPPPPAAVCLSSDLSGCLLSLGRCAGRGRAFVAPHARSGLTAAPAPSPARAREPWGQRRRGRTSARRPLGWFSALLQAARASSPR